MLELYLLTGKDVGLQRFPLIIVYHHPNPSHPIPATRGSLVQQQQDEMAVEVVHMMGIFAGWPAEWSRPNFI